MLNVKKQTIKMLLEPERKIPKPQRIKTVTGNLFGKAFVWKKYPANNATKAHQNPKRLGLNRGKLARNTNVFESSWNNLLKILKFTISYAAINIIAEKTIIMMRQKFTRTSDLIGCCWERTAPNPKEIIQSRQEEKKSCMAEEVGSSPFIPLIIQ